MSNTLYNLIMNIVLTLQCIYLHEYDAWGSCSILLAIKLSSIAKVVVADILDKLCIIKIISMKTVYTIITEICGCPQLCPAKNQLNG